MLRQSQSHLLLVFFRRGSVVGIHFHLTAGEIRIQGGEARNGFLGEAEVVGVQFGAVSRRVFWHAEQA